MAFKAYLTGSSRHSKRPNDRGFLVDGGCVYCFETSCIFLSIFVKNLPGVISLFFVTRSESKMLAPDLVSGALMLSRTFILFFCSSSSNSTRRKPAQ